MQGRTLIHAEMLHQPSLGEEVRGQLHAGTETCSDHCGTDATVQALDTLGIVDLLHTVPSIGVFMLGSHGEERRV